MVYKIAAHVHELKSPEIFRGDVGQSIMYRVPKYQRAYVWGRDNWKDLFNDIAENEPGHFTGAILCIKVNESPKFDEYEIIDGQQRLTTMSLFLAAMYKVIESYGVDNLDYDQEQAFKQIKNELIVKVDTGKYWLRIFPQKDEQNRDDYLYIMDGGGTNNQNKDFLNLLNPKIDGVDKPAPSRHGNRRLCKAYKFFKTEIGKYARAGNANTDKQLENLFALLAKINATRFVRILAANKTSANKLFEVLNNRGVPLTIADLIKNHLLSQFDGTKATAASKKWSEVRKIFSREDGTTIPPKEQERFFRQTYNAYRHTWNMPLATGKQENLYDEYEKLINKDATQVIDQLVEASHFYSQIQGYNQIPDYDNKLSVELKNLFVDLRHINGATSYTLLLYLFKNRAELKIDDKKGDELKKILRLLIAFFVRRNFTNNPQTNALERIFMDFIEDIRGKKDNDGNLIDVPYVGAKICEKLRERLKERYLYTNGGDDPFENVLRGDVYDGSGSDNDIRFVLVKLAENHLSEKDRPDFWKKKTGNAKSSIQRLVWSIEHVLPQTLGKGSPWIAELGCNNLSEAQAVQDDFADKLGNLTLTLTKYNSELSNKSFVEKRDAKDKDGKSIGYKDSLSLDGGLNSYIATQKTWTPTQIEARTELLIKEILKIFAW